MGQISKYILPFAGLKEGVHHFEFNIEKPFFEQYNFSDFFSSKIKIELTLNKKATFLTLCFKATGSVEAACDVTNEHFDLPIDTSFNWVVKFGDKYNNDNEEILILPYGSHQVDIAQPIYEMIILAIPAKIVHPGIEDGTLKSEILDKLEEMQPKEWFA